MRATGSPSPPHWQRFLYATAALALLLPIWSARYVPTGDGPCHVYNAWVLLHLDDPAMPQIGEHFTARAEPLPNWLIQVLLVGLLQVAPPLVAEKLLLSLYVLGFAAAAWYFAATVDRGRAANAFLLLPFAYHQLVYWGFYNFAFSVPLLLVALGTWWRHRLTPSFRFAVAINLLLFLCYFAHIVSFVLALLAIGVLWLASAAAAPWRRHALHLPILAPQAALPLWFVLANDSGIVERGAPAGALAAYLGRLGALFPHQSPHAGRALALLLVLLMVATLAGKVVRRGDGPAWKLGLRGEREAFLLVAILFTAVFLLSPDGIGGGSILPLRLSLFPFIAVIPWLAVPGRAAPAAIAILLSASIGWQAIGLSRLHRSMEGEIAAYVAGLASVERGSRLLPIVFGRDETLARRAFGHLVGWPAIDRHLVDWDDYQAASAIFPVAFRPGLSRPDVIAVEAQPEQYPVGHHLADVDYVYTWRMPPASPLRQRLEPLYEPVGRSADGELFRRRPGAAGPTPPG